MKFKCTDSSSSSLSSSCTSDGNVMDLNHPNYKKNLIATTKNAKSRKGKNSSELEPNSSTDDDGSSSSVCNTSSSFQKEKQIHTLVKRDADLLTAGKLDSPALKPEWPAESFEKKAWSNYKQGQQQRKQEEGGTKPMDKEMPLLMRQEPLTLVKSNSVSATKADNILKLDYITASSSNSYHAHNNHKLQGHRLSTGDSPLQKRYGSQGPSASLRTGVPSPGTPSRSSFSGVPTSLMQLNNKPYYNMVGRIAVNEGNGKLLPLYSLPPCCDQDANGINPGRLSVGRAAPLPSKWDDAEKWLVNASPSHPSQLPLHPTSKQAANHITNQALNSSNPQSEGKKNVSGVNKRVLSDVMVSSSSPCHSEVGDHHYYHHKVGYSAHTSKDMSNRDSYIQSRSLVPLASSSSEGQMHEDGGGGAMSDSELSNTQDECKSAFVRSTSHRQSTDGSQQYKYYMKKGQPSSRKSSSTSRVSKEELVISSPVSLQLERLKLSSTSEQLPKMHDVYAVESTAQLRTHAGLCTDEPPEGDCDVAGGGGGGASSSMTRLVVQAGKVVGRWGAGAMRDASTDVSPKMSMSRRDMGTQMTPVASSKTSRAATPRKSGSPVRHNTPTFGATSAATLDHGHANGTTAEGHGMSCQGGSDFSVSTTSHEGSSNSSWKSLQESLLITSSQEPLINNSKEMHKDMESLQQNNLAPSAQYSAWEEAERSKHMTKCAREEARIDAWESHQKAKAEAELKKLEMKLERLRAQATEKIMNKVATAHLRAEEMRAAARAQQAEQLAKALERANSLSRKGGGYFPESLGVCFSLMP